MSRRIVRYARPAAFGVVAAALVGVAACDPFTVSDPSRFTDEDVDQAPEAVARGVEGLLHLTLDDHIINQALLGDEWQHTGTWAGYDELDHGRARYGITQSDGAMNAWLRARFASQDAQERYQGLGYADTDPLVVQVKSIEGIIDLYLGQGWCEAPADASGPAVPYTQMYQQAITKLTAALNLAQQGGHTEWIDFNRAALARANLLAGDYDAAAAFARQVPDGFIRNALFSETFSSNAIVTLNTFGFNKAAGMREKWWSMVDTDAGLLRDPWTGELDRRVPIIHPAGSFGVDGNTPHFSQFKYQRRSSAIPIIKSQEMRLIEAEVAWRNDDLPTAVAIMNALRTRTGVGLSPLPDPRGDANTVFSYLLHERFAELFLEGHRLADLYRLNLFADLTFVIEVGVPKAGRLKKFPLSQFEAINNANIEDNAAMRCAPVA